MNDANHEHERPSPEDVEYPPVLRLTSVPPNQHQREMLERAEQVENGATPVSVRNFANPSDLRQLLTERRIEMIRSIMDEPPASIKALADRLSRGTRQVHDDVHLLEEYGIVHLIPGAGRARKPVVPHEAIKIEIGIGAESADGERNADVQTAD
jgi:predicted transcriptional regulator